MFQQLQWKGQKTAAWGAEGLPTPWSTGPGLWPRASLLKTAEDTDSQTSTNPRQCEGRVGRTEESQVSYKVSQRC